MLIKKLNVCFSCSEQSDPRACTEWAFSSPGVGLVSHLGFWERECPCNGCITGQVEMGNGSPGTPRAQTVLAAGPQVGPSWPTLNIGGQGLAGGRGTRAGLRTSHGERLKMVPISLLCLLWFPWEYSWSPTYPAHLGFGPSKSSAAFMGRKQ